MHQIRPKTLSYTFFDILSWMKLNKLLLNPSKTEFLLIGTKLEIFTSHNSILAMMSFQSADSALLLVIKCWLHLRF